MGIEMMIGTALGVLSGLGVGGGSLLILWLTLVANMDQDTARTINLLFFLPSASVSLLFRWKQQVLPLKKIWPAIVAGTISTAVFSQLRQQIDVSLLKKGFGLLLLTTGFRELLSKSKK